ncbi:hypothetical protein JKP88DRAFT_248526 [Tribonema minus]|uniref:Uncharacterized protein n=1 Tax=Tribonema minus TaxID=303371 RepID=A0A835YVL7_9STRA|nr:hypothetical protein JKP88DRAFT_248526 [Tribonema minus]
MCGGTALSGGGATVKRQEVLPLNTAVCKSFNSSSCIPSTTASGGGSTSSGASVTFHVSQWEHLIEVRVSDESLCSTLDSTVTGSSSPCERPVRWHWSEDGDAVKARSASLGNQAEVLCRAAAAAATKALRAVRRGCPSPSAGPSEAPLKRLALQQHPQDPRLPQFALQRTDSYAMYTCHGAPAGDGGVQSEGTFPSEPLSYFRVASTTEGCQGDDSRQGQCLCDHRFA